jgi:hypothetical protein
MAKDPDVVFVEKGASDAEKAKALASVLNTGINNVGGIIQELLKAGAANPLIAAVAMVIITDILRQNNIISQDAEIAIDLLIAAVSTADALKGTVTTLATGADAATSAAALLALLP